MSPHVITLISTVEPLVRDLVLLSLHGENTVCIAATITTATADDGDQRWNRADGDGATLRLSCQNMGEEPTHMDLPLQGECWTCALRDILIDLCEQRASCDPQGHTLIALPGGIELCHLVPGLATALGDMPQLRLSGVVHVLDLDTIADQLLDHHPLADILDDPLPADQRCTGELHVNAVGYADMTVTIGSDPIGAELVEHLRAHDCLLVPGIENSWLAVAQSMTHDPDIALTRIHPATTCAWGGPSEHGVRTLDLYSQMPFHPGRLRELVADLAGRGLIARGCFWLPSRPGRVCSWEVVGGVVSVGDAGTWQDMAAWGHMTSISDADRDASPDMPRCHFIVTGVDDSQCERVTRAFEQVLLRPDEMEAALAWSGRGDGLEDWFGH